MDPRIAAIIAEQRRIGKIVTLAQARIGMLDVAKQVIQASCIHEFITHGPSSDCHECMKCAKVEVKTS